MSQIAPAYVQPVIVRMTNGARSWDGWRATLQSGQVTVWRCTCRPHASYAVAYECGQKALRKRQRHSDQRNRAVGEIPATLSRGC